VGARAAVTARGAALEDTKPEPSCRLTILQGLITVSRLAVVGRQEPQVREAEMERGQVFLAPAQPEGAAVDAHSQPWRKEILADRAALEMVIGEGKAGLEPLGKATLVATVVAVRLNNLVVEAAREPLEQLRRQGFQEMGAMGCNG